jgi:polysaccharide biosynthesis protein PslH
MEGSSGIEPPREIPTRRPLLLLAPIAAAPSGNGLAMRVAQFVDAAAADFDAVLAVVPVAGAPPTRARRSAPTVVLVRPDPEPVGEAMTALLADPAWRRRVFAAAPLPRMARRAPPTRAWEVCRAVGALGAPRGTPVHVVRSYLAPLGLAVAEQLGAPWVTLDLDDDDEAYSAEIGDEEEAAAYRRLIATFAPGFAAVGAASPQDAAALGRRHGLRVSVLPNSISLPSGPARGAPTAPELLFVGNLTYPPNAAAAKALVDDILPVVRTRSGLPVTATLVGDYGADRTVADLATRPGVHLLGFQEDLRPHYDRAAVAVVPLRSGSGTKIKVLEAFAHRLPVVTTPAGAAGLDAAQPGALLVGERDRDLVSHAVALLSDPGMAHRQAEAAFEYVRRHHSPETTGPIVRSFLRRAAARGGGQAKEAGDA